MMGLFQRKNCSGDSAETDASAGSSFGVSAAATAAIVAAVVFLASL
jgi:hypothetical protein